jgi:microcystin synthetase protein McyA
MHLHHALWDGWSLESFATELYATYGLLQREGRVAQYRRLPSYNRFVRLEQSAVSSQAHRSHWLQKLDGASVPWWTGRGKSGSAFIGCEISEQTSRALSELARALGVQEKSVWCSVYLTLLSLLSGTDEVVGTTITQGRPEIPDGERMIGLFLNALPIRVALSGRWVDLIAATDAELLEQHAFRHYPLAEIQRLTGLDYSASMFNYTNWHVYYEGVGREVTRKEWIPQKVGGWQETNHVLSVFAHKDDKTQRSCLGIYADEQVFDAAFRERIGGYVRRIVDAMAGNATRRIDRTALLGDEERHRQLVEWNTTRQSYPDEQCIHELFEAQVARTPDRIALVHEGGELTYAELNGRANALAHRLIARGVGPERRVGLCMERSPAMVIGMLGILKAGGCYVPLDPQYPRRRLEYLLEDSAVGLLVSQRAVEELLDLASFARRGTDSAIEIMSVELDSDGSHELADNPVTAIHPSNLAYVIYTSGSTGQPKGVGIAHRSAVSLLSWSAQQWTAAERAGVLASTSICFDLSIYEVFLPLTQGNQCVLIDSILGLKELVQRERVTLINTVPSAAKALLEKAALPESLRVMNLAGEPLNAELVDALYESSEAERIYDLYGPSEGTTYSTYALRSAQGRETIGRPVANTQAYVVGSGGELLPSGVAGELHLGGVGLARGYLQRAAATAEKFIPHRFSHEPGERLYRTGDLVRWLADGALEYLGRVDTQVKVRGYRIEPGEIESALLSHPDVRDAVVVVREEAGEKRLVGYVVAEGGARADGAAIMSELQARLREQLPAYMVPSALMELSSLPLTVNGKVDRRALPKLDSAKFQTEFVAPRNEVERSLCSHWQNLLNIERIGIHDDFWILGGQSLLAMQVFNFVRQEFGVELKLSRMFANSTVFQLAECISLELNARNLRSSRLACEGTEDIEEGSF